MIDSYSDYIKMCKDIFDFPAIQTYLKDSSTKILINSLHGVTGLLNESIAPYKIVKNVFFSRPLRRAHLRH